MIVNIARMLKAKRKELGLSAKDVITQLKAYGISISDKTLYGWENAHRQPDADAFVALCHIYNIDSLSETEKSLDDNAVNEARKRVIEKLSQLSPDEFALVDAFVQGLIAKRPKL